MPSVIDKYNKELTILAKNYEAKFGFLPHSVLKHFFVSEHSMILEDMLFCQPDLEGLEKYENWLNEGNKTR